MHQFIDGFTGPLLMAGGERRKVCTVIALSDDYRTVDVTVDEVDQDFVADARQEMAAPVRPGQPFGHPDPGAGLIVARGVAGFAGGPLRGAGLGETFERCQTTPRKLILEGAS